MWPRPYVGYCLQPLQIIVLVIQGIFLKNSMKIQKYNAGPQVNKNPAWKFMKISFTKLIKSSHTYINNVDVTDITSGSYLEGFLYSQNM